MPDDLKKELLDSITELDRLGYTGGPDKWVRTVAGMLKVEVERTRKGWVVILFEPNMVPEAEDGMGYEWTGRETTFFKTIQGATAKARNYCGLIVTNFG